MKIHGYNGTSVKDIVDAAGVPKGSFYNYFHSKESFAVEALEAVAEESLRASRDLLARGTEKPLRRLQVYFEQNASQACEDEFKVGCFFGNMCQEMSDSNEVIRSKAIVVEGIKKELLLQRSRVIGTEASEEPEVNVLADRKIPFSLLKKIMSSCTSAGYSKISLAVIQKASQGS